MIRQLSKLITSICLMTFIAQVAHADVLIQADTASVDDYMAVIQTDETTVSLVDELEKNKPDKAHTENFLRRFEHAQALYLTGKEDESKKAFTDITAVAHEADWKETQRQALIYSFLRQAQLANNPGQQEALLQQAARFAPDIAPDIQLFPPPLLKAYEQIRKRESKSSATFSLAEKFPGYDLVIVDGRRYETLTENQMQLTLGAHRITLLSNSRAPLTQTMTASQLEVFRSDAKPLAVGSCNEPALIGFQDLGLKTANVFYDRNCTRSFTGTSWLKDKELSQAGLAMPPSDFERSLQTDAPRPASANHTWLWVGLGAALLASAALVYEHEHRGGERVQPVQKQGYSN